MARRHYYYYYLPLLLMTLLAAFLMAGLWNQQQHEVIQPVSPLAGKALPALSLPSLKSEEGIPFSLPSATGEVYILNVFASWCAGCLMEHPVLKFIAEHDQIPVYGIAWRDKPENTLRWLQQHGDIYRDIGIDADGEAAIALGITGAPESFVIAPDGTVAAVHKGPLTQDLHDNWLVPLVEKLKANAH